MAPRSSSTKSKPWLRSSAEKAVSEEAIGDDENVAKIPFWTILLAWFELLTMIIKGQIADLLSRIGMVKHDKTSDPLEKKGFTPLLSCFESFFKRNMYRRCRDCWNRPIASCPGSQIDVIERETLDDGWTFCQTGRQLRCLNLGSYNYLGFAESSGPRAEAAKQAIRDYGIGFGGSRQELGSLELHRELDNLVAKFLRTEAAITFPMGFATNALNLPAIIGQGCLILSDELNHCSVVLGSRLSGATVRTFKHGDIIDLEKKIRQAILEGQPKTQLPWKKIWIVVEGIYSMEGSIVKLPDVVRLKKKYKCYLYLDEAHSIGAVGQTGRGATEFFGCDPSDVDILMGTFSKSFGSTGGYIGGSRKVIDYIRAMSYAAYGGTTSAPVAMQTLEALRTIMGLDGTDEGQRRIRQLAWNTQYFRRHLHRMGFIVYGNRESPVVPIILAAPSKITGFSREMLKRNIAVVVVGYPATPLAKGRARICLSASHTKAELEEALKVMEELGLQVKYPRRAESIQFDMKVTPLLFDVILDQSAQLAKRFFRRDD